MTTAADVKCRVSALKLVGLGLVGGGGGGAGGVTSYIWHGKDVHVEWPPLSALPGIWLDPLFSTKKYMTLFVLDRI